MKKTILIFCVLFSIISLNAQVSFAGIWDTGQDNTKVKIAEENGVYSGTIYSSEKVEAEIGKQLLKEVKLDDDDWKGRLFSPKKGKWYDAKLEIKEGELHIRVKAGILKKTVKWRRVEN